MSAIRVNDRCHRAGIFSVVVTTIALGAAGCAGSVPPQSQDETAMAEVPATEAAVPPLSAAEKPAPAAAVPAEEHEELSSTILFDDQARPYRRLRIPKEEGRYKVTDDGRLQVPYGLTFYIDEEVDDAFYVKLFVPPNELEDTELPPTPEPAVAASAPALPLVSPGESDRLTFVPFDRGLPARGQWRNGFDVGDVDGDGFLDIVHGPPRKGASVPHLFLGDGKGDWHIWREASFHGAALDYGDAEVADFNGDGIADLAFAVHLRGIAIFVGDGEGAFELWSDGIEYSVPEAHEGTASFSSRAITSLDWNGDGRTDLLALGEGPSLGRPTAGFQGSPDFQSGARGPVVFLNQGDGTWERVGGSDAERLPFGDSIVTGDFDGDGRLDFATATNGYGSTGVVFLGQGDGPWRRESVDALGPYTLVKTAAAADFDGDGREELAVGTVSFVEGGGFVSGVEMLDRGKDGTWSRDTLASIDSQLGVWGIAAGDVDGDGRLDIAASTGSGDTWVLLGTPDGRFRLEASAELTPPGYLCRGYHVEMADLDGQPGEEIVVAFGGEPGSEQMIPGLQRQCPDEGALKAWKATPAR